MKLLVLVVLFVFAAAMERNKIYMRKAEMQDQAAAATGYIYNADSEGPASYVQYTDTSGNLANFGYPPVTLGHFENDGSLYPLPLAYRNYASNSYAEPYADSYQKGVENYSTGGGESYQEAEHSSKGEKGVKGYNNIEEFEKGLKSKYGQEEHKGHYGENGGNKKGYSDESKHYDAKHETDKGYKGGSASKSNGSKKGSKTTGYHKQYHKDEYKKQHTFYDESDKNGHFNKYGDYDSHHSTANGGHEKGGHTTAEQHQKKYGIEGHHDKGHYDQNDNGYKGTKGGNKYYKDNSNYGTKQEEENGSSYGYSKVDNSDHSFN